MSLVLANGVGPVGVETRDGRGDGRKSASESWEMDEVKRRNK